MKTSIPVVTAAAVLALALGLAAAPASAQVTVGVHAATTGIGPDLEARLNSQFTVRVAGDWLGFGLGRTYDNVHYDGRLQYGTGSAFLDWHPWSNALFLSAGAYVGDRRVTLSATPAGEVILSGQSFTAAEVGHLNGAIKLASAAPFAGFGVDSNAGANARGLGFKGVLGVAFSGKPSVSLSSSGGLFTGSPVLRQALAGEQDKIAGKAGFLQYYPVVQAGLAYKF